MQNIVPQRLPQRPNGGRRPVIRSSRVPYPTPHESRPVGQTVYSCSAALGSECFCRGQGRAPQARQDLGRATWSVRSRELCRARAEADGKPVTESKPASCASAQRAADLARIRGSSDGAVVRAYRNIMDGSSQPYRVVMPPVVSLWAGSCTGSDAHWCSQVGCVRLSRPRPPLRTPGRETACAWPWTARKRRR